MDLMEKYHVVKSAFPKESAIREIRGLIQAPVQLKKIYNEEWLKCSVPSLETEQVYSFIRDLDIQVVNIMKDVRSIPDDFKAFAVPQFSLITIPAIKDRLSYIIALHEVAHVIRSDFYVSTLYESIRYKNIYLTYMQMIDVEKDCWNTTKDLIINPSEFESFFQEKYMEWEKYEMYGHVETYKKMCMNRNLSLHYT